MYGSLLTMENLNPLTTESFSYRWLFNGRDSESPRTSTDNEASALEITTFIFHPKRFLNEEAHNFNFDRPATANSESADLSMVHADEIFSDGQIMPLFITRSKTEAINESLGGSITAHVSMITPTTMISQVKKDRDYFIQKWRELHSRILHKWFSYLKPLIKRTGISRKTAKVNDLKRKEREANKRWSNSLQSPAPQFRKAYSADRADEKQIGNKKKNLRNSRSWNSTPQVSPLQSPYHSTGGDKHDMECLVAEAILHCKRSLATS